MEIDPLSVNAITTLGQTFYAARRYEQASREFVKALEMDAGFPTAIFYVGLVHMARREYPDAVSAFAAAQQARPSLRMATTRANQASRLAMAGAD